MRLSSTVFTIGHGNRSGEELVDLLASAGIECLVDVRAHPGSRRHPQFGKDVLASTLAVAGIGYVWEGERMGGRRRGSRASVHLALRNPSFRAYADHMSTAAFREAIEQLLHRQEPAAVMCAERLPWQCHRYLIADTLIARGATVIHLLDTGKRLMHRLHPAARLQGRDVVYDVGAQEPLELGSAAGTVKGGSPG